MQVQSTIKTGKVFTMEFEDLPEISRNAIIHYGTQRWINDRVNSTSRSKKLEEAADIDKLGQHFVNCLREGKLGAQRSAVTRDPRLDVVVDLVCAAKGVTKKAVRAAVKEQGLDKFVAALGQETIDKELAKRAKLAEKVTDEATDALNGLL